MKHKILDCHKLIMTSSFNFFNVFYLPKGQQYGLKSLILDQRIPSSIPASNPLCSCHSSGSNTRKQAFGIFSLFTIQSFKTDPKSITKVVLKNDKTYIAISNIISYRISQIQNEHFDKTILDTCPG